MLRLVVPLLLGCTCGPSPAPDDGAPGPTPAAPADPSAPPPEAWCANTKADGCWLELPGGTFLRGAQATDPEAPGYDPDALPEEGPVRTVQVSGFWITQQEVAMSQWLNCVDGGGCTAPEGAGPQHGQGSLRDKVAGLTWTEADQLCRHLGGRLPTEAEWEYAARGSDGRRWPWGDTPPCGLGVPQDRFAQHPQDGWDRIPGCEDAPTPASPRGRSPHGLWDAGWGHAEWVADWFAPDGYDPDATTDPTGPANGTLRVLRGGSWTATEPSELRVAARLPMPPDTRTIDAGVRCAW